MASYRGRGGLNNTPMSKRNEDAQALKRLVEMKPSLIMALQFISENPQHYDHKERLEFFLEILEDRDDARIYGANLLRGWVNESLSIFFKLHIPNDWEPKNKPKDMDDGSKKQIDDIESGPEKQGKASTRARAPPAEDYWKDEETSRPNPRLWGPASDSNAEAEECAEEAYNCYTAPAFLRNLYEKRYKPRTSTSAAPQTTSVGTTKLPLWVTNAFKDLATHPEPSPNHPFQAPQPIQLANNSVEPPWLKDALDDDKHSATRQEQQSAYRHIKPAPTHSLPAPQPLMSIQFGPEMHIMQSQGIPGPNYASGNGGNMMCNSVLGMPGTQHKQESRINPHQRFQGRRQGNRRQRSQGLQREHHQDNPWQHSQGFQGEVHQDNPWLRGQGFQQQHQGNQGRQGLQKRQQRRRKRQHFPERRHPYDPSHHGPGNLH